MLGETTHNSTQSYFVATRIPRIFVGRVSRC